MKRTLLSCAALLLALLPGAHADQTAQQITPPKRSFHLHNGWTLSPAGTWETVSDMLLGCALSPDGRLLALTNAGYNDHHLYLVDTATGKLQQTVPLTYAWNGLAWASDGKTLYAGGGAKPIVHMLTRDADGKFTESAALPLPGITDKPDTKKPELGGQAYVSGVALARDGQTLYVANFATDTVFALHLPDGAILAQTKLETDARPYCLRLSADGKTLYVSESSPAKVVALSAADLSLIREMTTEKHPTDLLLAPDGRLFVTCGLSDSVLALDPATGATAERISVTLTPNAPAGTTPNALGLSPDGKTLYVANADNNDVAVVDISAPGKSQVKGFIPTGWYPTAVCPSRDGKRLFIASGKGLSVGPNSPKLFPADRKREGDFSLSTKSYVYVGTLFQGLIATVPTPTESRLAAYTKQVMANTPYRDALLTQPVKTPKPGASPVPSRVGDPSPIKHVLYIIKENRTYDQVFGDLKDKSGRPRGNGDPDLTLFGEDVTPNLHELARQYVTLDNTYCNGDVSGNGHPWSTSAYGTDLGERAWMLNYSGKADWWLTDRDIYPRNGRIWEVADRAGLSSVSYYYTWTTDNTKLHMSKEWDEGYGKRRDPENADLFIKDLHRYERENNLPNFMIMALREDHTNGTSPGAFTPRACVASNDYGVGKIVDAFSKSRYWKETAIFIIQDDAQDGPDHVEAHRTEALVVSPWTRTGKVDSTFYTTTSLLRTMELILGLPPMSQYDAAATPMYNAFASVPNMTPFTVIAPRINLNEKNTQVAYGANECQKMDFSGPDRLTSAQVDALNRILWHSIKGLNAPYPAPVRRALLTPSGAATSTAPDTDN